MGIIMVFSGDILITFKVENNDSGIHLDLDIIFPITLLIIYNVYLCNLE